jgi:hypothetical protein
LGFFFDKNIGDKMEKRYISLYVESDIANKFEAITNDDALNKEILSYVDKTRNELKDYVQEMDENVLLFKAQMITARDAFKKAKQEELDAFYSIWEKYDEDIASHKIKVKQLQEGMKPLFEDFKSLQSLMNNCNVYAAERVFSLIEKFNNFDEKEKEMMKFFINNFK